MEDGGGRGKKEGEGKVGERERRDGFTVNFVLMNNIIIARGNFVPHTLLLQHTF